MRPFGGRTGGRRIGALALALAALGSQLGIGAAAAFTEAHAVTWSVDHSAKTITAKIRLTLTSACTTNQLIAAATNPLIRNQCRVTQEMANEIKAAIERVWNNGNKYYCYDIVVQVDVTIDERHPAPDPDNRAKVQISQAPTHRSFVSSAQYPGSTWDGNTPSDQNLATNDGAASSTWTYPAGAWGETLYAHEAGHILGLDDAYEDYTGADGKTYSRPKAGVPVDLMSSGGTAYIDKSTIRRMVERAGITKSVLECNYRIDQASMGGRITGQKCDPPGGQWIAQGTYRFGQAAGSQEWIITINAATLRGDYIYTDHQVATFAPGITTITDGVAVGRATVTIDDELRARIHLQEQSHTFTVTTAGGGKGHDQDAPLISLDLVWEPIGKC